MKLTKTKRMIELAMSFWIGIGLMSIINVWKITQSQQAVRYSWIMFIVSVIFIVTCTIYLLVINKKSRIRQNDEFN
jgi:predicted membrane channel-forming protein YqfA (hemolysin III family)